MTPNSFLSYTVSHFKEVARQNRYAENGSIEHDRSRCAICHPELVPLHPFEVYLEVVVESVKVRRPRLDQELVDEINSDLALAGINARVSLDSLEAEEEQALQYWSDWIREAISTGLGLLSVHGPESYEFYLDDLENESFEDLVREKIAHIIRFQKENR